MNIWGSILRRFILAGMWVVPGITILVATPSVEEAKAYFHRQEYKQALDIWYDLERQGRVSGALYYNIGLAESQRDNVPGAVMAFEKALRFKPSSAPIRKALSDEREKIESATIPLVPFFLAEYYQQLLTLLRPGQWAIAGMLLLGFAVVLWLKSMRDKSVNPEQQRRWMYLGVPGLLVLLLAVMAYQHLYRQNEAIVIMASDFHQAPSEESPLIRTVSAAEKVYLLDRIGEWHQVRLLNYDEGWIRQDHITVIRVGQ